MKYIQYKAGAGKKVFHLCVTNAWGHEGALMYNYISRSNTPVSYCNGNHPMRYDTVSDTPIKNGKLCSKCKEKYLKNHTEEELFLEMM